MSYTEAWQRVGGDKRRSLPLEAPKEEGQSLRTSARPQRSRPLYKGAVGSAKLVVREEIRQRARTVSSCHLPLILVPVTAQDAALVQDLWGKIAGHTDDLGGEALDRLFASQRQTKIYFSHMDISPGSADVKRHGGKVLNAIGEAAKHADNLDAPLSKLIDLHAYNLRVDPGNFQMLSHCIQTTLAAHFPADFTPEAQSAWDKFLAEVSAKLTSKYR